VLAIFISNAPVVFLRGRFFCFIVYCFYYLPCMIVCCLNGVIKKDNNIKIRIVNPHEAQNDNLHRLPRLLSNSRPAVTVDWLLLTRWHSVVRHVTMRARATRRVVS